MNGIIYSYQSPSGKYYIGKTMNPEIRRALHIYAVKAGKKSKFYNAVRKYGWDSLIYKCQLVIEARTKEELNEKLNEMETYYIAKFNSYNDGYNMTPGGDGGPTNIGHVMSNEEKEKHRKAMSGKKFSEEHKRKIREANIGKHSYLKKHHFKKGESYRKGKHHTEETKQKMSKA